MADRANHADAVFGLAVALLAVRHYGYKAFPTEYAALAWNIIGAALFLGALVYVAWRIRRGWALYPLAWWMAEEIMVIGCNAAFIVKPWTVRPGDDMCRGLMEFDFALVGALVLAALAMFHAMRR